MEALENIRVLDLSRILAGPYCTQILGDLGADVIKIERPGSGDDTRGWGPPFLKDGQGKDTTESAYFLSVNRNKKSLAIDIKTPEGQALIHRLIEKSDVVIENFKVGGLTKYGLSYEDLKGKHPGLIYCSITGFGQTGPMAKEPGYDFLAQGLSGLMACTGEPGGQPMKVGVALSDIMTGLNAAIGILAALNHRNQTGQGQHVDVALTDCTLAAMTNLAQYYLTSGEVAPRLGNAHSAIVPYQTFESADGHVILAIGNDEQFARFSQSLGQTWHEDARFAKNTARVQNREILVPIISEVMKEKTNQEWLALCDEINVPCSVVNSIDQTFTMEQIRQRQMQIQMPHPLTAEDISLVGSPLKLSETPATYNSPPPLCGQDTESVLKNLLDLSVDDIAELKANKVIGCSDT